MSEPQRVGDVVRTKFWEQGLRTVTTRPGLSSEQRERWRAVYELELARAQGEAVTREECALGFWRTSVWERLRRKPPADGPPSDGAATRYMLVRRDLAIGVGIPPLDIAAAYKAGQDAFQHWWSPIEAEVVFAERAVVALHVFGGHHDGEEMRALLKRGDDVASLVQGWRANESLVWAPEFVWRCHPADEWFRPHGNVGKHDDAIAWWQSCRPRADALMFDASERWTE